MNAPLESPSHDQTLPQGWTAAQLAIAARLSKRWLLKRLAITPAIGSVIVQGNETAIYSFDALPASVKTAIAANASATGLSIAEHIEMSCKPWQPARPWSEIDDTSVEDAKKLRTALLPALQRQSSKLLSGSEKARMGLDEYRRVVGHEITVRHWQRLIERTLRRAGVSEDLERLELYLSDNPKPKMQAQRLTPGESEFTDLSTIIQGCADPSDPTDGEKAAIWAATFEIFAEAQNSKKRKQLRRSLVKFLWRHASALAESEHAMRVAFDRKLARWIKEGKTHIALLDGRRERRGAATATPFPPEDLDTIQGHATLFRFELAPAVRDLCRQGERSGLSKYTLEHARGKSVDKSYVNRRLINSLPNPTPELKPFSLGKKAVDDHTASIERKRPGYSMQVVSADDFTMPVWFYVPDENGWYTLATGQVLIFVDCCSMKVIAWSFTPEPHYCSLNIRTLMNQVCQDNGLPRAWQFENGIWRKSHAVKGTAPAHWSMAGSGPDCETNWQRLGVRFNHTRKARAKIAERVGDLLQDRMSGVRGFRGREMRYDCPEATKRAMDDLKFRRVAHPGELFLSFEEWEAKLGQIIADYNSDSQQGRTLNGLSPNEAFEHFWPHSDPPVKLDASCAHLCAHYVREFTVGVDGICFRLNNKSFRFFDGQTGRDRGKKVKAWFNSETPDFICVTDMNGQNPYLVERSMPTPYLAEPGDPVLENELAKVHAHNSHLKARYHSLKAKFGLPFRRNMVDAQTAATGQEFNRLKRDYETKEREKTVARKSYSKLGMSTPRDLRPGQAEAAKELASILDKNKSAGSLSADASGQLVYKLKASGTDKTGYVDYLLSRLTEFRKIGGNYFGQKFNKAVTFGMTRNTVQSHLKCSVYDESRFDEICVYLKESIDKTIKGKNNIGNGFPNYHGFENRTPKAGAL